MQATTFDPPGGCSRTLRRALAVAITTAVVILLAWVTARAITLPPSFDGAMNLQVSWSLANGEGYRRTYADRPAFPREVQTNVPVTVPAAAVYGLFGMGLAQSQVTNLAYLYVLLGLAAFLVGRRFGPVAGAAAALLLLATPNVAFEGLRGYGEIPSLVWALAALCLLPSTGQGRTRAWRWLLAGIFFGLALATKTVIAICVGAFGLCMLVLALSDPRERWPHRIRAALLLAGGLLLPLLAIEAWRMAAVGGPSAWSGWWLEQWNSIQGQTGTRAAPTSLQGYIDKWNLHVAALAGIHGLTPRLALAWLLLPFGLAALALWKVGDQRRHLPLYALLLAVALYFGWWLLLTPDSKLWQRRILCGGLMLNLVWVYVACLLAERARRWRPAAWSARPALLACVMLAGYFTVGRLVPAMDAPGPSEDYRRALDIVSSLPADAAVFGLGWNSAPQISLLAGRPFRDFNDFIPTAEDRTRPAYLVLDGPGLATRAHHPAIDLYPSEALIPGGRRAQVYRLDLSRFRLPDAPDVDALAPLVRFDDGPYEGAVGFGGAHSAHNWMGTEAFVQLVHDGGGDVFLRTSVPGSARYEGGGPLRLSLRLDGCPIGSVEVPRGHRKPLRLPIPEACMPREGAITTLSFAASDVLDQYIGNGGVARSVIINEAGFAPHCPPHTTCEAPGAPPREPGDVQASTRGLLEGNTLVRACGPGPALPFEVRWDASGTGHERVQLLIRGDSPQDKLWAGGQQPTGTKRTGPWMREGMSIVLADADGSELDVLHYALPPCPARSR